MVRNPPPSQVDAFQRQSWTDGKVHSQRFSGELALEAPRSVARQTDTYSRIQSALNNCGIADFAIAVVDQEGEIEKYTSPSLRNVEGAVFSSGADGHILQSVGRPPRTPVYTSQNYGRNDGFAAFNSDLNDNSSFGRRQSESTDSSTGHRGYSRQAKNESSDDEASFSGRRKRARNQQHYGRRFSTLAEYHTPQAQTVIQTKLLKLSESQEVAAFYTQRFRDLQQSACKVIAKAFVKIIEPKKQTNYPYTGGYNKAPLWWPLPPTEASKDGVRHREPDHLLKPERVRLLVHILCLVVDPNSEKPDAMRNITVRKLEEVTNEAMTSWYVEKDHPDNITKKPFLREIFKVAKHHERYKRGELDDSATISVAHGDNLQSIGSDDEPDDGVKYDEEEVASHELTPPSSLATPPDSVISPMSTNPHQGLLSDPRQDPSFYSNLPVRPQYHGLPAPSDDQGNYGDQYRSQPGMYQTQSPVFQQQPDSQRRGSAFSMSGNGGFSSPAPTSIYSVPAVSNPVWHGGPQPMHQLSPQHYSTYTAASSTPHQSQTYQLPPPTSMIQPPPQQTYSYEPLPQQHPIRTSALPGQGPVIPGHAGGFSDYLIDGTYPSHEGEMKHDLSHQ